MAILSMDSSTSDLPPDTPLPRVELIQLCLDAGWCAETGLEPMLHVLRPEQEGPEN